MDIEISPRRSGKTTKMIKWLGEKRNRILLTFSQMEAERLKREYPELSDSIYYWEVFLRDQYGMGGEKEVGIDNADMVLQNYSKYEIKKITFNK